MYLNNGPDAGAGTRNTRRRGVRLAQSLFRSVVAAALMTCAASGAIADFWSAGPVAAPGAAAPTGASAAAVSPDSRAANARLAWLLLGSGLGPGYLPIGLNGASLAMGAAYYTTSSEPVATIDRALWCEEVDRALWCEEILNLIPAQ